MEVYDSPSLDLLLSKFTALADTDTTMDITLFVKGVIISGEIISVKTYVQILEEHIRNSTVNENLPPNVYELKNKDSLDDLSPKVWNFFKFLFDQIINNFSGIEGVKSDRPVVAIHLKNCRYKVGNTWSNTLSAIRVNINSMDAYVWGKEVLPEE